MPSCVQNQTDEFSSALFTSNPLPSFIIHAVSLRVVSANKSALQCFQYPSGEVQKLRFIQLFSPSEQLRFIHLLQHRKAATDSVKGLFKLKRKNATVILADLYVSHFSVDDENYYQVVCVDIKPEFPLASIKETPAASMGKLAPRNNIEKNRLMATLVEETSDVLTAVDLDFKPLSWNKASEKIYGLTAAQAIGNDLRSFLDISYPYATREEVRATIKSKGEWRGEMTFTRPTDQRRITLLISFKLRLDEKGVHVGYITAGTDITERKEQEFKLKETENRFRGLADAAPVGIWVSDADNKITYVNKTLLHYTGLSLEAFNNCTWLSMVHPEDQAKTLSAFQTHFLARQPVTLIYRLQKGKSDYCWVQDTSTPRFLEDGTFVGYIGSVIDIHDTKSEKEQLQYQAWVLENVQDTIISTGLDFRIKSWNKMAEQVYGYTEREAVGKLVDELIQYTYANTTKEKMVLELEAKGIWKGEVIYIDREGSERYFLHTVSYFTNGEGERTGILSVGRDVTDRRLAEEKLQASELFYRSLIADALDGILLTDESGRITFVSPSINHILGYDASEVLGRNCFEFVHPDDSSWAFDSFQKEVSRDAEIQSIVVRLLKKNGEWLWCLVRGNNLLNNLHIRGIVIYFHDDTERKQASEALKESEKRFRNLISDLQVGVILYNAAGETVMCNKAMQDLLMVQEQDLHGKSVYDIMPDDIVDEDGNYIPKEARPLSVALLQKQPVKDRVMGFRQAITSQRVWILVNTDPVVDETNNLLHIICTVKDITDRKRLEQELLAEQIHHQRALTQATIDGQEKERREIGKELHDNIGQQLTTTKLYLDLAKATADDATNEMVSLALKSISDVINEIRTISHALVPPTLGDLGIIESIEELIHSISYGRRLQIDFDYFEFNEDRVPENQQLMLFRIIQEQLNNVVKHAEASRVHMVIKNKNQQLKLEITDNGQGFDAQTVRRGLGLTNIHNRAELFGGKVEIVTAPGQGCTLKVIIPARV